MAQELIYTSATSGLKPGSKGFCTVAATNGIPPRMVTLMESLSGYRHAHPPTQTPHPGNPVAWSHLQTPSGESLLSRVADAGLDYSGRSNKIAHHLLLGRDERSPTGPAAMMRSAENFVASWTTESKWLGPRTLSSGLQAMIPASTWKSVTGDPGWAGVLAQATIAPNQPDCFVIFESGQDVLALFDESLALLTPDQRWKVSFSTFFARLPPGMSCQWRAVLKGSTEHRAVPPHDRVVRIDLTVPSTTNETGTLIDLARTGQTSPSVSVAGASKIPVLPKRSSEPVAQLAPPPPPQESTGPTFGGRSDQSSLPAFQDHPPILASSVPREPERRSSKKIVGFVAVLLLILITMGVGYVAVQDNEEPAKNPIASKSPKQEPEPTLDHVESEPLSNTPDPIDTEMDEPASEVPSEDPMSNGLKVEPTPTPTPTPTPETSEAIASATTDISEVIPEPKKTPAPEPKSEPEPTPIRLRYLLEPVVWRQYAKQKEAWTGDQSVYRRSLDLEVPDRVAAVSVAANGDISKDEQLNYDTASNALVFGKPSDSGLVPPTKVMLFEPGTVILQPNYAKRIGDRFIIVQNGSDWSLLTIQGAILPESGMDRPKRTNLSFEIGNKAASVIDLGSINPNLLRLARFQLDPSSSWTAKDIATGTQISRSFRLGKRIDDPTTKVFVDLSLSRDGEPRISMSARLEEPPNQVKGEANPEDDSRSVLAARKQLPTEPIEIDLVAEIRLGKTAYSTIVSQFIIGFK